ncbi:2-amino-4-hydroxy-6-hydroxymethyldihydropteridine diphosphokinase [Limnohabitans sp. INBF002]|uniref:2-amino-4-hydroxy-6- hydroxymethyldihydropteridine diphosphokinase n=1 Tax=Limnohabitans sp. INBF002 TaxID=2986280 RepID=UPI002376E9B2|nr:2-amino-4-hydroxy-6-hydroxymethyldihydropteridine diphosphokinase [Limnohabitans sp. INBF002]BDU53585.1 2-amino-4-hydroxy-6-hydroxymethyldihydropteridine pyrophosphokinase [Limnohabitans sp. INBF002]
MSTSPVMACVALGANLGDAVATVQQALRDVAGLPGTQLLKASSLYRSAPYEAQGPDFINAVALLQTQLSPLVLLHALQAIELKSGRERPYKNAPRTLDLDVIFYGDVSLDGPELILPHPRWQERAFVLQPLFEVWPERVSAVQLAAVQNQAIQRINLQDLP